MTTPLLSLLFFLTMAAGFQHHAEGIAANHCLDDQKSLLLDLKSQLLFNATLSTKLVTWNSSRGSFDGVTCENGLIVGLDLTNESISGGINGSSVLFRLQHIRRLNLAYNSFGNSLIPSGMGYLTGLVYLNLSNAGFAGQIPMEISRLTRLAVLDLSSQQWHLFSDGTLKIETSKRLKSLVGNLTELKELYMDEVNMSAMGNKWCEVLSSSIPKLEVLSMSNCFLLGPIEPSLLKLSSLSVLRLSNNNFSTPFPEFISNFSGLTTLNLIGCGLHGEVPSEIFQIQTLKDLVLADNQMLGGSIPEITVNSSLQRIELSRTNFSGSLPESIGRLTRLSRIELSSCSFSGSIPSSMEKLQQLSYLDLSGNNLTGPIPPFNNTSYLTYIILSHNNLSGRIDSIDWGSISNLVHLDLRLNSLEGSIPSSLLSHPSLLALELSRNSFSGLLDESLNTSSSQLRTLDLSLNCLQGPIPRAIFEIERLVILSLSSNNFSGSLHVNLFRLLKNLSYVDLSNNFLSVNATTAASTGFPSLSSLNLASCQLTTLPEFLASQSMLVVLDLSKNQIKGRIPRWIWKPDMLALNLSHNMLEDLETPPYNLPWQLLIIDLHANMLQGDKLPVPPSSTYLDYSSNKFNSTIPSDIGKKLSVAIYFSLANNSFHGDIPKSICEATYLQVLDLSNNNFTGGVPKCLTNDTLSLKVLMLRNNNLTGSMPDTLSETCGLRTINLNGNRLQGQVPESLSNCKMIEVLDLGNNQLQGLFPCHLRSIPKLRVLILKSNRLWGDINCPESDGNNTWETLQIIDLSSNSFGGMLPGNLISTWESMKSNSNLARLEYPFLELSGLFYQDTVTVTFKDLQVDLVKILTVFTSIDFSSNKFEGPIPEKLGNLKALKFLNLSRNAISGRITPSLGNLQQLESLDLSWNDLYGTIPKALSDLNFLVVLNLSYNRLEGSIPRTKQFPTFTESSYLGNGGLCGLPLERTCPAAKGGGGNGGKGEEEGSEDGWLKMRIFYMAMPFGGVVGFWGFIGLLMYFSATWRRDFFLLLNAATRHRHC